MENNEEHLPVAHYINLPYARQIQIPTNDHRKRDINGIRLGDWESPLLKCCIHPVPNGWMSCCFPCISIAQIGKRIDLYGYHKCLIFLFFIYSICYVFEIIYYEYIRQNEDNRSDGLIIWIGFDVFKAERLDNTLTNGVYFTGFMSIYWLVICIITFRLRVHIRRRFDIPGNICLDCLAVWFCSCCSIAQMANHVQSYKRGLCDFGQPDTLPAYPKDDNDINAY